MKRMLGQCLYAITVSAALLWVGHAPAQPSGGNSSSGNSNNPSNNATGNLNSQNPSGSGNKSGSYDSDDYRNDNKQKQNSSKQTKNQKSGNQSPNDEYSDNQSSSNNKSLRQSNQQNAQWKQREIEGEVVAIRQLWINNGPTACVVTLRCDNDKFVEVDLGPARSARYLGLQLGDRISAEGKTRSSNGFSVMLAEEATKGDHTFNVKRNRRDNSSNASANKDAKEQGSEDQSANRSQNTSDQTQYDSGKNQDSRNRNQGNSESDDPDSNDSSTQYSQSYGYKMGSGQGSRSSDSYREITGKIEATQKVTLRDSQQQNLVAKVKTDKGRTMVIDLGPASDLEDLHLQKGERITARGYNQNVRGGRVLVAERLQADGESMAIRRHGRAIRHYSPFPDQRSSEEKSEPSNQ
jgi:hypothetical protein